MLRDAPRHTAQKQLRGLDKPTDPALDRLARLAVRALRAPTALVAIVGMERQDVIGCAEPSEPWAAIRQNPLLSLCCQYVVASVEPLIVDDTRTHPLLQPDSAIVDPGMMAYAGMPIVTSDGVARGAFCVIDTAPRHWTADERDTLRELTQLVVEELDRQAQALARAEEQQAFRTDTAMLALVDRQLLHEVQAGRDRLQTLSTQLLHAQEAERRAIARELHDEIGQELTIIEMSLQELLDSDPARMSEHIAKGIAMVERVLAQVRDMALDLRPSQLDDLGLAEALRWYLERHAARANLDVVFDLQPLVPRPPAEVEVTCFRIAQEAMTNVLRSAQATHVWITLGVDADGVTLMVRDDGRGFDVAAARGRAVHGSSLGLLNMEERAALIGGRATVDSTPGEGTTVRAWLPSRAPDSAGAA